MSSPIASPSPLVWNHWEIAAPPAGRLLVITNQQSILFAKRSSSEPRMWDSGVFVLPFDKYPLWAEHPKFTQTAKKVGIAMAELK